MLDRDTNRADELAEALKNHQRDTQTSTEAQKRLAIMEQLAKQMEDDQSERDRAGSLR
jgi:hypothetical protein